MLLLVTAVGCKMSISVNVRFNLSNLDNRSHCKPMNIIYSSASDGSMVMSYYGLLQVLFPSVTMYSDV